MSSPLPPDPYLALGVAKDASSAVIKAQYRKLVLKFHPDKVRDESQKQAAADQFHKIQTAYEIVGDEDKRARYDAQCKLAQLKKDVIEKGGRGPVEVRTAAYKVPTEAPRSASYFTRGPERVSPVYEERRPGHVSDYFDSQAPRTSVKKETEYERSGAKRAPPRDERERVKARARDAKESERARQGEKTRTRERERGKDRDRKAYVEDESSSGDEYEKNSRRMWDEDAELRRVRAQYHDQTRRQKEEAAHGYYDGEERARKLYSQYDAAKEHIEGRRRPESVRRPSPERASSAKDKTEYIKRSAGRPPVMVRRESGRPKAVSRDTDTSRRSSTRDSERRPSLEVVDEHRRPPTLVQSKSSPVDIRPPLDRQRSQSVQIEKEDRDDVPPRVKRSETMPYTSTARDRELPHRKDTAPQRGSGLRRTEIVDGQPTPVPTPGEGSAPNSKYRYHTEYADDHEFPTPDGYRTEIREPTAASRPRYTRSPSPLSARDTRDKPRATSTRYASPQRPPMPTRTTSTSYVYTPGQGVESYRPSLSREESSRGRLYYGEIPTTTNKSPKPVSSGKFSPPLDNVRYQKEIRPEDIRVQSGYEYTSRRPGASSKPSYSRSNSSAVYAR